MVKGNSKQSKIKPLVLETFLSVVEKSVGTKMFQTIWAEVGGRKTDATEKGDLSCAFYVSAILAMFGFLDHSRATVKSTEEALVKAGWKKTKKLAPGTVIVWGPPRDGSHAHNHIGFYIGGDKAISNSSTKCVPTKHHVTFGRETDKKFRPITAIYRHPKLK